MADRDSLRKHISKSASDLSQNSYLIGEVNEDKKSVRPQTGPPCFAQYELQKAHSFFATLKSRWRRSRSGERRKKKPKESVGIQKNETKIDYIFDNLSEPSSSVYQSPQRKPHACSTFSDCCQPAKLLEVNESASRHKSLISIVHPPDNILPNLSMFSTNTMTNTNEDKKKELNLCQHSFFQLQVHLKRGIDLIARDKGGTSDPYVKFKVGNRLLYKSKVIYRSLNPIWDETFTILVENVFVPLHIKVFDYDWGLQDDFMGSAYLDLRKLDLEKSSEITLKLLDPGKTEYLGMICLNVKLLPKTLEDRDLYFQKAGKIGEINKRLRSQIWSSVVTIVLVEGKNLQGINDNGLSDLYVKFRLGEEKYKSKIIFKSLNPTWLEQFDFHLYDDQNQELEVTVWAKEKLKDDFLGRCQINLSLLEREQTHGLWQNLEKGNGLIHILLTISGTTASESILDLTTYDDVKEKKILNERYSLKNSFHNLRDVGHLTVKVYRATGLAAADLGGKSDPFCVLELVNARLQTQTEYKTLSPSWQKIFNFNVKDINSVLEITVFDEDRDHKVEFLGKVIIPLLRIQNGKKKWYSLKDKKLRSRAKGNYPMILLEMSVVWNVIRACARTLNPKEKKYMQGEMKFKRQVFVNNVLRLKAVVMILINWGRCIEDFFEWKRPIQSIISLVIFIGGCYYFEPYMIPAALLIVFLQQLIVSWLIGSKCSSVKEDEDVLFEEDYEDDDKDKEEKKSLKDKLQAVQEVTQSVQNTIGRIASFGEQIKNTFNFTIPFISYLAILLILLAMVVMYFIPIRYLIMAAGVNRFARKLLRPHTVPNNEILDLLSRVPDDEDLVAYREFRPFATTSYIYKKKKN